jgi:hypothetical protein
VPGPFEEIVSPVHGPREHGVMDPRGPRPRRAYCVNQCGLVSKAAEGNAGRSVDLAAGKSADLLNLACPDECAGPLTVTVDLRTNTGAPARGYCIVLWGTAGHQAQAEIDCSRGTSFTIAASFLRVTAVSTEPSRTIVAGAFVGVASGPSLPPIRTVFYDNIGASGGFQIGAIPAFGAWVTLQRSADGGPMGARFSSVGGTEVTTVSIAPGEAPRLAVPGTAVNLIIFNDSTSQTTDVLAVYELALAG